MIALPNDYFDCMVCPWRRRRPDIPITTKKVEQQATGPKLSTIHSNSSAIKREYNVEEDFNGRGHVHCRIVYSASPMLIRNLLSAEPAAGAATSSPKQIKITFNESVIPQFSGLELKDQNRKGDRDRKAYDGSHQQKAVGGSHPETVPPGDYKVEWHAVSDDTHRVKGSYSFSVAR